ncbi:kinase-like protein [Viridothelium virens]|uniref:Kinase-like protein n=1 Tax=Viridothelium virens TaxID=1048519 RepID=A0A6A6HP19_VIRVR|nr:kinase-like protein [Viridothelium virens]
MIRFLSKIVLVGSLFLQPIISTPPHYTVQSWKYLDDGEKNEDQNLQLCLQADGRNTTITTLKHIGSGGSGSVYKAKRGNGTEIALKRVRKADDVITPNLLTKSLSHPNINHVYEGFRWNDTQDNWQVYLMELNAGPDLNNTLIKQKKKLTNAAIRSIFLQVLDAIRYAHAHHLYHFHPKPPNIVFVGEGNWVKLVDFDTVTNHETYGGHRAPKHSTDPSNRTPFNTAAADVWHLGQTLGMMLLNDDFVRQRWFQGIINARDRFKVIKRRIPMISDPAAELLGKMFAPVEERISSSQAYDEAEKIKLFTELLIVLPKPLN